ncbi:MAG: diadenylate cyclase [Phycisphaerales bacterium]
MSNTIEQFMWPYQRTFRGTAQVDADKLFGSVDSALAPQIFLIGYRMDGDLSKHPICIEPEQNTILGNRELRPADLNAAFTGASFSFSNSREGQLEYSDRAVGQRVQMRAMRRSLANATANCLNSLHTTTNSSKHFCSATTRVGDYEVLVVLQLAGRAYELYPKLHKAVKDELRICTSLLDGMIDEFLAEHAQRLEGEEPGRDLADRRRDADELMRRAGRQFSLSVGFAASEIEGAHQLFEVCESVAAMKYEGAEGNGSLVVCRRDHPCIDVEVAFQEAIALVEHRGVRKLIEAASGGRCLFTDGKVIYGIGRTADSYSGITEDLYRIAFRRQHAWEVFHDKHLMMRVVNGVPQLPRESGLEKMFVEAFARQFKTSDTRAAKGIWRLVSYAAGLSRGFTVAISTAANDESKRLGGQGVSISPTSLTESLIELATSIDGAVLLTPDGVCHAFGIILDGVASSGGLRSRGSRYNSAARYCAGAQASTLVVIASEDGMVDFLEGGSTSM